MRHEINVLISKMPLGDINRDNGLFIKTLIYLLLRKFTFVNEGS